MALLIAAFAATIAVISAAMAVSYARQAAEEWQRASDGWERAGKAWVHAVALKELRNAALARLTPEQLAEVLRKFHQRHTP